MQFSLALLGALASLAGAQTQSYSYTSTAVLTTVVYYTHTVAPSHTTYSKSAPVYKTSSAEVTPSSSSSKAVPYYSASGSSIIPLSPSTYTSSMSSFVVPTYTATAAPTYYTGAASHNTAAYGGAVAVAAVVAAFI